MNFNEPTVQEKQQVILLLENTKNLLSNSYNWTKKALARTDKKYEVGPLDKYAVSWDIAGAIEKVAKQDKVPKLIKDFTFFILTNKSVKKGFGLLYRLNDSSSHEELLGFIQETIDELKSNG